MKCLGICNCRKYGINFQLILIDVEEIKGAVIILKNNSGYFKHSKN